MNKLKCFVRTKFAWNRQFVKWTDYSKIEIILNNDTFNLNCNKIPVRRWLKDICLNICSRLRTLQCIIHQRASAVLNSLKEILWTLIHHWKGYFYVWAWFLKDQYLLFLWKTIRISCCKWIYHFHVEL